MFGSRAAVLHKDLARNIREILLIAKCGLRFCLKAGQCCQPPGTFTNVGHATFELVMAQMLWLRFGHSYQCLSRELQEVILYIMVARIEATSRPF